MEFLQFESDDFRDCRDIKAIVGYVVGDIPGSFKDGMKYFLLDALDVG